MLHGHWAYSDKGLESEEWYRPRRVGQRTHVDAMEARSHGLPPIASNASDADADGSNDSACTLLLRQDGLLKLLAWSLVARWKQRSHSAGVIWLCTTATYKINALLLQIAKAPGQE